MNAKNGFLKLLVGTLACFGLAYVASSLGGINTSEAGFPYSVGKRYADQAQTWITVKNLLDVPGQGITEFNLKTLATDVHFEVGETEVIKLRLEGKYLPRKDGSEQVLQYEVKGHALLVKTDEEERSQGFQVYGEAAPRGSLTVILPKHVKKIGLKVLSGTVTGEEINLDSLSMETVSGELSFSSFNITQVSFKTVSGEIGLSGTFQKLEGRSVSGNVGVFSVNSASRVNVTTTSGDVDISYPKKPDTVIEFKTASGAVRLEKSVGLETEAAGSFSRVLGSGSGIVQVNTTSGNLHLSLASESEIDAN